ncbi:MAG: hypothetical protein EHM28_10390 [Spirochaetaceae bacterium]|nr:MAG: hypothetical protein EHM28_10390 [Spirochaetaceae bacterium]
MLFYSHEMVWSCKMRSASAWAPGHITGFFEICDSEGDILHSGSRGAGISLAAGCTTRVFTREKNAPDRPHAGVFGIHDMPVSKKVIELFYNKTSIPIPEGLEVIHKSSLPPGAGFGSSGAGVLSLSLAINALSDAPLSVTETAQIAHEAEVLCGTGLGTVLGDTVPGLEARTAAGAPGTGAVRSFPLVNGLLVMACVFGPLFTKKALADNKTRDRINESGGKCLDAFLKNPVLKNLMSLARDFAENTGLISHHVRKVLDLLDKEKIMASMTMFGDAVYTIVDENLHSRVLELFSKADAGHTVFESAIAEKGAYVIDET